MNRKHTLSSIRRDVARHAAMATTPTSDLPLTRLSIAQLDQAGAALLPRPAREVCPDCMGSRETEQHVTDDITRMLPCRECGGRGYLEEV